MMGQRVKTLIDRPLRAGLHNLTWNGGNEAGVTVSNGVYFYRMDTDLGFKSKKMMFLK